MTPKKKVVLRLTSHGNPRWTRSRDVSFDSLLPTASLSYTPAGEDVVQVMGTSAHGLGLRPWAAGRQCQKQEVCLKKFCLSSKRLVLFSQKIIFQALAEGR